MIPIERYKFTIKDFEFDDIEQEITRGTVVAESTYAGKPVIGVAKCHPRDTFDLQFGMELAAARCNAKVAEKRLKRANQKLSEVCNLISKARRYQHKFERYLSDAAEQLEEAENDVDYLLSQTGCEIKN